MTVDYVPLANDFRKRRPANEVMDDPELDPELHHQALLGLSRVNQLSATTGQLWRPIRQLADSLGRKDLRILDIATGGGDVAIDLKLRANREGYNVAVEGCDISPEAIQYAGENARRRKADVTFFEFDALNDAIPSGYDVILSTLFLHHLETDQVVKLLRNMNSSTEHLVVISDLRRSRFAYWLTWVVCRIISRSPVVHADGPLSVAAAFTVEEIRELADQANMLPAEIKNCWPWRFLITAKPSRNK